MSGGRGLTDPSLLEAVAFPRLEIHVPSVDAAEEEADEEERPAGDAMAASVNGSALMLLLSFTALTFIG